ncbi:MAG: M43 family zinc metalloprotease [Cytophagales bacterium]|nr:M43 family zinc metalloprotease [Cytophagales bacterium]
MRINVNYILITFFVWCQSYAVAQDELRKCANENYHKRHKNHIDTILSKIRIEKYNTSDIIENEVPNIIKIPVVVHILHNQNDNNIGGPGNPNITDEQIKSQITVLNEDYRKVQGTRGYNTHPDGADTQIEFYLAKTDPDCNPTTGITRHYVAEKQRFNPILDELLVKSYGYWPSTDYLNIWVCSLTSGYIGYAQFPNRSGLSGLYWLNGTAATDGVIITSTVFGNNTGIVTKGIYGKGRTATHEIGHWLGLLHTWGDNDCDTLGRYCTCGEDYVYDTPPCSSSNLARFCSDLTSQCSTSSGVSRNMTENYLDYSPDECMNIFTQGQKYRMRQLFQTCYERNKILSSGALKETVNTPLPYLADFDNGNTYTTYGINNVTKYHKNSALFVKNMTGNAYISSSLLNFNNVNAPILSFDYKLYKFDPADTLYISITSGCNERDSIIAKVSSQSLNSSASKSYILDLKPHLKKNYASCRIDMTHFADSLIITNYKIEDMGSNVNYHLYQNLFMLSKEAAYDINTHSIKLKLLFESPADIQIQLMDMYGKKLYEYSYPNANSGIYYAPVHSYPSGVYIVRTALKGVIYTDKVVIVNP